MEINEAQEILNSHGFLLENDDRTNDLKDELVMKLKYNMYNDLVVGRTQDVEGVAEKFQVKVKVGDKKAIIEYNSYDEEYTVFINGKAKTLYNNDAIIAYLDKQFMENL